ncbi:hypothetical protein AQJ91_33140 [Streptomyces dysideae]|uniref:Uncharacterized protein n=2 Tax=Streptomyces dysideae TaxID=909626 RepID=A0A101UU71_9ACTN|nr:hypothetical protein AQJ91_33140 [Streptomyces dysideae]
MGLPALAVIGFVAMMVVWVVTDDEARGAGLEKVPCADALHFGGAELPDGAQVVGACEVQGFQDIHYSAAFRMPRADVRDWLTHTYPDAPAPETEFCGAGDVDLCLDVDHPGGHPDAGAHVVQVNVEHEGADTALVRFAAFTL